MSNYFRTQSDNHLIIPLDEILRDMHSYDNVQNTSSSSNTFVDAVRGEITSTSILSDLKEGVTYHDLDQPKAKAEPITMDASFICEENLNRCIFPAAPEEPAPISPFHHQYDNASSIHFFNYHGVPFNYNYNFPQQPNYIYPYPHTVQSNVEWESHNSLLSISEGSAFTPIKPKYFSPRLLSFENQNDSNQCNNLSKSPREVLSGRKKTHFGIISHDETNSLLPTTSQTAQFKDIQEILAANSQIPIVSIF